VNVISNFVLPDRTPWGKAVAALTDGHGVTGLYDYGYRDYMPGAARFTAEDPIRDGANWFAYVNNNPVNWVDRWGLSGSDLRHENQISPKVPPAPPGVDIGRNIKFVEDMLKINLGDREPNFMADVWVDRIRKNGAWDYKREGSQYEDFGNFNYGATGSVLGCSPEILSRMAGLVQILSGNSKSGNPFGSYPYGDDSKYKADGKQ
jgi:hypothetical protein